MRVSMEYPIFIVPIIQSMIRPTLFALVFISFSLRLFGKGTDPYYNVRDYGAKGDGKNMDSPGINKAIDAAAADGGGTVYLPAGNYLSGSIHLKSNITLMIDQGATLVAANPGLGVPYDEPEILDSDTFQDFGHSHFQNSLIWGEKLEHIAIIGNGTILGTGLAHNGRKGDKASNKSTSLKWCKNVLIRDINVAHGG
jgi:polygalacturonase